MSIRNKIQKLLREDLEYWHSGDANKDKFKVGVEENTWGEVDKWGLLEKDVHDALIPIIEKHKENFGFDSYGVIDAVQQVFDNMFQRIGEQITESEFRFNDGRLNKQGHNTIYMDDEPIVDFGVGKIGNVEIGGQVIPNAIYLQGGFNASAQGKGYGTLGIKTIFDKLPKIQHLILQCYDTACPFWSKMGATEIESKDISGSGKPLRTMVIKRDDFMRIAGERSL